MTSSSEDFGPPSPEENGEQPVRVWQWVCVAVIATGLAAVIGAIFVVLPSMLAAAYDGESIDWLNRKIAAHSALAERDNLPLRDKQWYLEAATRYSYRLAMYCLAASAFALLFVFRRTTSKIITRFLRQPDYAFNLGVLRAVVFGMLTFELAHLPIAEVAALPNDLYKWPALTRWALAFVPIEPWYVSIALPAALTACALACLGWFTRWTALVGAGLAYTLIGIPTLTGKVDHYHHVLIAAGFLALSRSGDGFSFDALCRRYRAPSVERTDTQPQTVYGLPIRLTMIVIALVYFFPGFWKAAVGPGWVLGGAMTNTARTIWFQREYFEPLFRIDNVTGMASLGALGTIAFEMGFLPAIFFRWPRRLMALIGMGFHIMVRLTMGISFLSLQVMYVVFVDFRTLLQKTGALLQLPMLTVYYDESCDASRRLVNLLLEVDWLQRLNPSVDLAQLPGEAAGEPVNNVREGWGLRTSIKADNTKQFFVGNASYRQIIYRVPILWPLVPLAAVLPLAPIGRYLFRHFSEKRERPSVAHQSPATVTSAAWSPAPLFAVFSVCFLGLIATGFTKSVFAWPVACYPTFDSVGENYTDWPLFFATTKSGQRLELNDDPLREHFGNGRYVEVLRRFVVNSESDETLSDLLTQFLPIWESAEEIDPADPPKSIEVFVGRFELTGPTREPQPSSLESRFVAHFDDPVSPHQ